MPDLIKKYNEAVASKHKLGVNFTTPEDEAKILIERRNKQAEEAQRNEWLNLPSTKIFINKLDTKYQEIFNKAKHNTTLSKEQKELLLEQLATIDHITNLIQTGYYDYADATS